MMPTSSLPVFLALVNLGVFTLSDFEMRDGGCKMKLDALKQCFPAMSNISHF